LDILNQTARASIAYMLQSMPVANGGYTSGCSEPLSNLDAPTRNLQNIKHKHAGQLVRKRVAPNPSTCRCGS